jgi:pyruvate dehydrogenase E2 component (dihydrolipoamide acetyltransferase)
MATPVAMPKLGMTMEEGTLVKWEVEAGGRVAKGEILFVIETEKAEAEIEATASGYLRHTWVGEGETVPCGTLLAALTDAPDESLDLEAFHHTHDSPETPARIAAPAPAPAAAPTAAPARSAGRKAVAPAARKLALTLGVDAAEVPGSGPGGRVTKQDVQAFADARAARIDVGDGVFLDVPTQGEGDAVLLLPGFGTDVSAFAPQVDALAADHRVLGVNPRGVGVSDAPEQDAYPVAQTAADAAAVIEEPAHVVGASLGAAAALELALGHPERVRSLTLITPFLEANGRLLAVTDAWTRIAAAADREVLARALLPWLFSAAYLADDAARERTARGLAATVGRVPAATLARTAAGLRAWAGSRAGDLAAIAVPTLVIAAGEDLLTPGGAAVAGAIPKARSLVVPGAGHAITIEAAGTVSAAIREHVSAVA